MLSRKQKFYLFIKRLIDILGSSVGIVLLSPFLTICAIITKLTSRGPVLFKQDRLGKNESVFRVFKFRSMKVNAPQCGAEHLTPDQQKALTTKWGEFMRKTSIDEMPQLFNIFLGQMSFIGPRPGLAKEKEPELTAARESYLPTAYAVKPGLSGYSQIFLKRSFDVDSRAKYDSFYVKHVSLWLDIKLFIYSFLVLFGFTKGQ